MNNAKRRITDVEKRLGSFEAPEPPTGLIEGLKSDIPADLGAANRPGAGGAGQRPWLKMAASLAVVAVGGLLGFKLLQEGPSLEEAIEISVAEDPVVFPSEPPIAEAERRPDSVETRQRISDTLLRLRQGRRDDRDDASVRAQPKPKELGAAAPVPTDRVNVGGNESGQQSVFVPSDAPGRDGANENRAPQRDQEVGKKELDSMPQSAPAEVVPPRTAPIEQRAEAPKPLMNRQATAAPEVSVPSQSLDAPQASADQARRELKRKLSAVGYVSGVAPSTGGTVEPNDQPVGDMFFQGHGTNPFVDTEDDRHSTFGIDVDTASYTLARSYIERGSLPPTDAIRVEEFVNYFDYGDPAPRRRDFAVVAEGAPSPFSSTARTHLLRFALKGREIEASQRKPAVLTFVIDVSGSMNRENRLGLVKGALHLLVEQLDHADAIGLVVYGSRGQVILEPTSDHRQVMAAIDRLQSGGSTNAEEGLVLGYSTARRFFRPGAINRVILCSDGVANVGRTGPDSILARIAGEAEAGIELTTVGFGMGNYNDVLMEQLADKGDGNYAYVDDLDAARRVFVDNLTGTLQTIAGDAKIQVEFEPRAVQSYRLLGYENRDIADRDFRNDAVDAGEIGAGHQVTALYEVKLKADAPKRGTIATLRLRYRSKESGRVVEDAVGLAMSDLASSWSRAPHALQLAAVTAEFAEILKGSYWARESSLASLAARARSLAGSGPWDSEVAELANLIERAAQLRSESPAEFGEGIER